MKYDDRSSMISPSWPFWLTDNAFYRHHAGSSGALVYIVELIRKRSFELVRSQSRFPQQCASMARSMKRKLISRPLLSQPERSNTQVKYSAMNVPHSIRSHTPAFTQERERKAIRTPPSLLDRALLKILSILYYLFFYLQKIQSLCAEIFKLYKIELKAYRWYVYICHIRYISARVFNNKLRQRDSRVTLTNIPRSIARPLAARERFRTNSMLYQRFRYGRIELSLAMAVGFA